MQRKRAFSEHCAIQLHLGPVSLSLPRFDGRVSDRLYAASCNCASYSAGLTKPSVECLRLRLYHAWNGRHQPVTPRFPHLGRLRTWPVPRVDHLFRTHSSVTRHKPQESPRRNKPVPAERSECSPQGACRPPRSAGKLSREPCVGFLARVVAEVEGRADHGHEARRAGRFEHCLAIAGRVQETPYEALRGR